MLNQASAYSEIGLDAACSALSIVSHCAYKDTDHVFYPNHLVHQSCLTVHNDLPGSTRLRTNGREGRKSHTPFAPFRCLKALQPSTASEDRLYPFLQRALEKKHGVRCEITAEVLPADS